MTGRVAGTCDSDNIEKVCREDGRPNLTYIFHQVSDGVPDVCEKQGRLSQPGRWEIVVSASSPGDTVKNERLSPRDSRLQAGNLMSRRERRGLSVITLTCPNFALASLSQEGAILAG